ncbi:MAG: sigma-54-dependent Fis family transcriptional regulator [Acidobacteriota bacterium]|nr:sigma-54-dependent Fis family transcriptional regulator [Acidobacteriota bacterium]
MDRYKLFHKIATDADLASMQSILRTTLDRILRATDSDKAAWFASGPGGLRPIVSLGANGIDLGQPEKHFIVDMMQKAVTTNQHQTAEMPSMTMSTSGTARGSIRRYLAVPVRGRERVTGVLGLDRRYQANAFTNGEIEALRFVLSSVQQLLNSSRDYERQAREVESMKSQMAMDKVNLVSKHPTMLSMFRMIQKLAKVPATVLIQGESGTGKELVARAIYELGNYDGPFIAMNCGGIEPNLLKSELFGHVKGSFTGAQKDRPGLFKKAEGGVLFMDEIGEMPSDMQVAMLRTLENSEIMPVGADRPFQVKTRVVAATHRNLREMVVEGTFRNDLFQRLKGLTIEVPPLRKRRGDIPHLCNHFVRKYNDKFGLSFQGLRPEAADFLAGLDYSQGNVRELEHMIERAMVFEDDEELIGTRYLQADEEARAVPDIQPDEDTGGTFEERMNRYGAKLLVETIQAAQGNKSKAMKMLGLSRSTFYGMINRYGVEL